MLEEKINFFSQTRQVIKRIIGKTFPLLLVVSMSTSCAYFSGNIHPVKEGKVYRSAQLNDGPLEEVIRKYEIKTMINLRGESNGEEWYEDEISICEKYGVKHYDLRFSTKILPKKESLLELFEIFDNAEYPLIFHCKAGADRAGLAGAIYKLEYEGKSLEKALKQLSIRYGHIGVKPINDFFKLYKKFGHGKDLRTWVTEDYDEIKHQNYFESYHEQSMGLGKKPGRV